MLENLVLCPCGHTLAQHDYTGCSGERRRTCPCRRERHDALEAAVDSVRTWPVFSTGTYGTRAREDDAA